MKIAVLPGDGIGDEITNAALDVLNAVDRHTPLSLDISHHDIGFKARAAPQFRTQRLAKHVPYPCGMHRGLLAPNHCLFHET